MHIEPAQVRLVNADVARRVVVPAFDAMSAAERRALRASNPVTYLHAMVEADDADSENPIDRSAAGMARLLAAGVFGELRRGVFVYRMGEGPVARTTLIARMRAADMRATVLPHEETKATRVTHLRRYAARIGHMSSPVSLAHRLTAEVRELMAASTSRLPLLDFATIDGLRQTVWAAVDDAAMVDAFAEVERAYITDGHHRVAAAGAAPGGDGTGPVLVALTSQEHLQVQEFNRVVAGVDVDRVLDRLLAPHVAEARQWREAPHAGQVFVASRGRWWHADLPAPSRSGVAQQLDVAVLHDQVLAPLGYGHDDPRVIYVPGTVPLAAVAAEHASAVVIGVAAIGFDQVRAVADAGEHMPPKTTYFRPKPRSGIFLHPVAA